MNVDIVMCQTVQYDELNQKYITSDLYNLSPIENMGDKVFNVQDIQEHLMEVNVVAWNKLYKKSFLDKTGEKFPEGFIYEDLPFFFGVILKAKKIKVVWKKLYIYRQNSKDSINQLVNKKKNNKVIDRLDMISMAYDKLKKYKNFSDIENNVKGWIINDLFHRYILLKENYHKEFFFRMKKIFQSLEINDIENPYWSTVYHFQGYLMVLENDFESFNQKIFTKYLDIHEIENRLRIEMRNTAFLDKQIQLVYEEITRNYKYTEDIRDNLKEDIKKINEKINVYNSQIQAPQLEEKDYIQSNYYNEEIEKIKQKIENLKKSS